MEDEIVDILVEVGGGIFVAGVSLVALATAVAAAQWFFYQFSDRIFDYLRGRLRNFPKIKTVVMALVQKNHEIVECCLKNSEYVIVRYLGLETNRRDTKDATEIRRTESNSVMTAEELKRSQYMDALLNNTLTRAQKDELNALDDGDLAILGIIPKKVAIGKKMMDGEGKVLGAAVIADESKVLELRN